MPREGEETARILVDWTARQIHDPLVRLRFLRALAPPARNPRSGRKYPKLLGLALSVLLLAAIPASLRFLHAQDRPAPASDGPPPVRVTFTETPKDLTETPTAVWPVEDKQSFEIYSNGLRIENEFQVGNRPRSYRAFPLDHPEDSTGPIQVDPVGIVFHTTESLQAPFEPEQTAVLKRVGESLLEYVRRRQAYNFVIDRFGRVYRIVREGDAANHAGHSVWADESYLYVNLNDSFLGVSFEAQTAPAAGEIRINPAQVRAATMLTEMLRSRYRIAAGNCVTHAQVSVNPANMQVGYHTDWASSFPFASLGLPDNYARPLPSLALFGFRYDSGFARRVGSRLAASAELGERQMNEQAGAAHLSPEAYRRLLRSRYSRLAAARKLAAAHAEGD